MKESFSKDEIDFIKKNYPSMDTSEIAKKLNRTKDQIKNKATSYGISKNPTFSDADIEFIKNNYGFMKNNEISNKLNKKVTSISNFAKKNGLKKEVDVRRKFSLEDEKFLIENYSILATSLIADKFGMSVAQVKEKAVRLNVRKFNKMQLTPVIINEDDEHRSELNQDFFKTIDTERKAYWLGFLYADGYVYTRKNGSKRVEICLAKKDEDHIQKLLNHIGSKQSIKTKKIKLNEKIYLASKAVVNGRAFAENLEDKGCVQNKSLILTFPSEEVVPKDLQRDFIRGYFDGDGCCYFDNEKVSYSMSMIGTKEFLETTMEILNKELGLKMNKLQKQGNAYSLTYAGFNNFSIIQFYLYNNSSVFLDRKYEKAQLAINTKRLAWMETSSRKGAKSVEVLTV